MNAPIGDRNPYNVFILLSLFLYNYSVFEGTTMEI